MIIVDAHLDLSYNALRGRDVRLPASRQSADDEGIPTVGLPDLRAGQVSLICATIFCSPSLNGSAGYHEAAEAYDVGTRHIRWYHDRERDGDLRLIRTAADLTDGESTRQRAIILLEGADPIRTAQEVPEWFAAGVRIVGLAWKRTRYAGGTGNPGPLTPEGLELVHALDAAGIMHDTSHLAEESFWQLMEISRGPVMASHSNCRSIVPTDRQLSDDMARALFRRDGVIGINFFDKFLVPPGEYGRRRATLDDVAAHVRHFCDLAGDTLHVGLGTDMDGGLGRDEIPRDIITSADLPKVADALSAAGFDDAAVRRVMGDNWLNYFRKHLPAV